MFKANRLRAIAAMAILALTVVVFANYFQDNPSIGRDLKQTSPWVLAAVFGLYLCFVASLAMVNTATLKLCKASISQSESVLLTIYSSIINFFGPLQSGPAFRALYVNRKHGIKLRDYTLASFVYYFFYALFSGMLLLAGWLKEWSLPVALAMVIIVYLVIRTRLDWLQPLRRLVLGNWHYMALASLIQVLLMLAIYYVELSAVTSGVSLAQAAAYTGAANFALFVSLTPGAIGFRESFLLFSQSIHHIDAPTIVAASVIDRGVYIILLVLLAVYIFTTHAKQKLLSVQK